MLNNDDCSGLPPADPGVCTDRQAAGGLPSTLPDRGEPAVVGLPSAAIATVMPGFNPQRTGLPETFRCDSSVGRLGNRGRSQDSLLPTVDNRWMGEPRRSRS